MTDLQDFSRRVNAVDFWSANPCDGHASLSARRAFRYRKEPWLLQELLEIGKGHAKVLEVGCGQGTDALTICGAMKPGGYYIGIDYSSGSISAARQAINEAGFLPVVPEYRTGDANNLPFDDKTFDAAYSMGVLHHLEDTYGALHELRRVTRTGGKVCVALYNANSIKVRAALFLRSLQRRLDELLRQDRCLLPLARVLPRERIGTMAIECFGVPILKAYSEREIRSLFSMFSVRRCVEIGQYKSFWFIEAQTP